MTDILGPANAANAVTMRPGDTRVWAALDSFFRDCSSDVDNDGTDITAAWLNGTTSVLRALWRINGNRSDGATPVVAEDGTDDNGLAKAVNHLLQRNQAAFGLDTSGAAGAITVALSPAAVEYKRGMRLYVLIANTTGGATTINVNGLGAKAVTRRDGSQLLDGDLVAGGIAELVYDGSKFQVPAAWGRPQQIRNTTIYVNGAIGNDANDGTANDAQHAMATVRAAINLAFRYSATPYLMTIKVADGVYNESVVVPLMSGPPVIIDGNAASPANVVINGGGGTAIVVQGPNVLTVKNLKVQTTTGHAGVDCYGMAATSGATLNTVNTVSGITQSPVFAAAGATINLGNHTFSGSAEALFYGSHGGFISLVSGVVFTISAPITVVETALVANTGSIQCSVPAPTFVNAGYVTGKKYQANSNGTIDTQGAGENYFPGSLPGVKTTGGQYL